MFGLSKSRYCNGVQCPKMIWMKDNKRELAEQVADQSVLANGNVVGDFKDAERLTPDGLDIPATIVATKQLLNSEAENIAEASFSCYGKGIKKLREVVKD